LGVGAAKCHLLGERLEERPVCRFTANTQDANDSAHLPGPETICALENGARLERPTNS